MAYLLVLAADRTGAPPSCPQQGDVVGVFPDDWTFGTKEKDPALFQIIHVPGADPRDFADLTESDTSASSEAAEHAWRRKRLNIASIEGNAKSERKVDSKVGASIISMAALDVVELRKAESIAPVAVGKQVIE